MESAYNVTSFESKKEILIRLPGIRHAPKSHKSGILAGEPWHHSHVWQRGRQSTFAGALQLITTSLDYDLGAFWVVNDLRMTLDCAEYFSRSPETFPQFETVTRSRHFSIGEGLPGTVWSTREVLHIPDVTCAENFPRFSIAKQEGLRTGIGFPLYSGKTVLGVVELFSQHA